MDEPNCRLKSNSYTPHLTFAPFFVDTEVLGRRLSALVKVTLTPRAETFRHGALQCDAMSSAFIVLLDLA
jgi:hypothetical protein